METILLKGQHYAILQELTKDLIAPGKELETAGAAI